MEVVVDDGSRNGHRWAERGNVLVYAPSLTCTSLLLIVHWPCSDSAAANPQRRSSTQSQPGLDVLSKHHLLKLVSG